MMTALLPSWLRDALPDLSFLDPLTRPGPVADVWAAASLIVMIGSVVMVVRGGRWPWRVVLLLAAASWPLPDHPAQGPILLDLSYQHGVHAADLLSVVAAIVAVLPWHRSARARNRRAPAGRHGRGPQGR